MSDTLCRNIHSSTVISVIAIIAFAICFLADLGFSTKVSVEKEKIEVITSYSNLTK